MPHLRHIASAPFGRVVKSLIMQAKGQAFVQLESVAHATHMVTFYRNAAADPVIRGQSAKLDFSNHVSLEVSSSSSSSSSSAAGGASSSGRPELAPNSIILIAIADQRIPVTVDHLAQALAQFGEVLKIVTFTKAGVFQVPAGSQKKHAWSVRICDAFSAL